jgi:hypothetical protein
LKGGEITNDINDFTGKSMLYIIGLFFIGIYLMLVSYGTAPLPDFMMWFIFAYGTIGFIGLLARGTK